MALQINLYLLGYVLELRTVNLLDIFELIVRLLLVLLFQQLSRQLDRLGLLGFCVLRFDAELFPGLLAV